MIKLCLLQIIRMNVMECNGDLNAEKRMKDAKFTRVGLGLSLIHI